jgi:hypothetical protein
MKAISCETARYYDLIELPHGHIPAPKIKFWRKVPIPIGRPRNENFFQCFTCGESSFFKTFSCGWCEGYGGCDSDYQAYKKYHKREKSRMRWKKVEYAILPLLLLFDKVRYNQSTRIHHKDSDYREPFYNWPDYQEVDLGEVVMESK